MEFLDFLNNSFLLISLTISNRSNNMKFVWYLLLSIAVFLLYFVITPAVRPCPHPYFLDNHLCTYCYTLEDAADFTKYRPNPTGRNTVFFGRPTFEIKTYMDDRCGNVDSVKVAVCSMTNPKARNSYTCTWMGDRCYGEHSIANGHLFYRNIKCF